MVQITRTQLAALAALAAGGHIGPEAAGNPAHADGNALNRLFCRGLVGRIEVGTRRWWITPDGAKALATPEDGQTITTPEGGQVMMTRGG